MALTPEQLQRINQQTGGGSKRPPVPMVDPKVEQAQVNIAQGLMRARRAKQTGTMSA